MTDEIISFTGVNYEVCNYCTRFILGEMERKAADARFNYCACDNRQVVFPTDLVRLKAQGIDAVNSVKGCDKFYLPSGL